MRPPESGTQRTFILVPGAGHGGWAWQPVAKRLRAAGHVAAAITLPGMGPGAEHSGHRLRDATVHVIAEIDQLRSEKVTLVGHSLGGLVVATVAAQLSGRIEELVFVSAWVPRPGTAFADAAGIGPSPNPADTAGIEIPFEYFASAVMQGLPKSAQRIVYELLTPTPVGYVLDPYPGPELTTLDVRMRYIVGADDHALVQPALQSANELRVQPTIIPGTHEVMLTHPDELAQLILADDRLREPACADGA